MVPKGGLDRLGLAPRRYSVGYPRARISSGSGAAIQAIGLCGAGFPTTPSRSPTL